MKDPTETGKHRCYRKKRQVVAQHRFLPPSSASNRGMGPSAKCVSDHDLGLGTFEAVEAEESARCRPGDCAIRSDGTEQEPQLRFEGLRRNLGANEVEAPLHAGEGTRCECRFEGSGSKLQLMPSVKFHARIVAIASDRNGPWVQHSPRRATNTTQSV
jgi:hypothetical protein